MGSLARYYGFAISGTDLMMVEENDGGIISRFVEHHPHQAGTKNPLVLSGFLFDSLGCGGYKKLEPTLYFKDLQHSTPDIIATYGI